MDIVPVVVLEHDDDRWQVEDIIDDLVTDFGTGLPEEAAGC